MSTQPNPMISFPEDGFTPALQILEKQQDYFASILEIANEAIISINQEQYITFFNKGAEQIFGYTSDEIIGEFLDRLIPDKFVARHRKHIANFINSGEGSRFIRSRGDIVGLRKNGEEFPAEASISKIDSGEQIILTVVLRDITKRKQAEYEREQLIEELNAFAHTVAHDLREPINLIVGYANLLKEQARLPDELQHYLNAITRTGNKMGRIIDELQLLAGVRNADIQLKPLHMARIVANVQQQLAYLIEESKAQIIMPEHWPIVLGHAPWIEVVWANYLTNAIKYGGQPPYIQLGATTRSDGMARFWVRDNGPGLSPEAQMKVFNSTIPNEKSINGHGLGLSIVQRIIERLGGQVGVESEAVPGKGCIFFFTLPKLITRK